MVRPTNGEVVLKRELRSSFLQRGARRAKPTVESAKPAPQLTALTRKDKQKIDDAKKIRSIGPAASKIMKGDKRSDKERMIVGEFLSLMSRNPNFVRDSRNIKLKWTPTNRQKKSRVPKLSVRKFDVQEIRKAMEIMRKEVRKTTRTLEEKAKEVKKFDDHKAIISAEEQFRRRISEDLQFDSWKRELQLYCTDHLLKKIIDRMHANMTFKSTIRKEEGQLDEEHIPYALDCSYTPPSSRILVMENLTGNSDDIIPVYSDLPGETKENFEISKTLLYTYGYRNLISTAVEKKLKKFNQLSKEIKCNCCSTEPMVPCWANPDCDCSKVAKALRKGETKWITPFGAAEPEKLHYYCSVDFSCSELCGCKGQCTNNSLLTIGKNLFQFEIYRRNKIIGNSVRTMTMIPAGSVVSEFVGELECFSKFAEKDNDFTYTVIQNDEELAKKLDYALKGCPEARWNRQIRVELEALLEDNFMINPKHYGNVSRTFGHSCAHNLVPARVFQKGFSPANVRLILVALHDIFPGSELSIDYGDIYMGGSLEKKCLCGALPCISNPSKPILDKDQLKTWAMVRHENSLVQFRDKVSSAVDKKRFS